MDILITRLPSLEFTKPLPATDPEVPEEWETLLEQGTITLECELCGKRRQVPAQRHQELAFSAPEVLSCETFGTACAAPEEPSVTPEDSPLPPVKRCPLGHALEKFKTPLSQYMCDRCGKKHPKGTVLLHCPVCTYPNDFDCCVVCPSAAARACVAESEEESDSPSTCVPESDEESDSEGNGLLAGLHEWGGLHSSQSSTFPSEARAAAAMSRKRFRKLKIFRKKRLGRQSCDVLRACARSAKFSQLLSGGAKRSLSPVEKEALLSYSSFVLSDEDTELSWRAQAHSRLAAEKLPVAKAFALVVPTKETLRGASSAELQEWRVAIDSEVQSLLDQGVVRAVPLSEVQSRFKATPPEWLWHPSAPVAKPWRFLGHDLWVVSGTDGDRVLHVSQESYLVSAIEKLETISGLKFHGVPSLKPELFEPAALSLGAPLTAAELRLLRGGVGALGWAAQGTRWELQPAVGTIAGGQSEASGRAGHLLALKHLIGYVKNTVTRHLHLAIGKATAQPAWKDMDLVAHSDASFPKDEKPRMGFVMFLNGTPVLARSKKESTWAQSTAEAELVALTFSAKELVGYGNVLEHATSRKVTLSLFGDNKAANLIGSSQASVRKVRHLTLSDLFIRDLSRSGRVTIDYVKSALNGADTQTKILGEQKLLGLLPILGLGSSHGQ